MKEQELNTMLSVVADPIENVYKINSYADAEEIRRMCRIFSLSKSQNNTHKMFAIRSMASLKVVLSKN
jgi:hypothetical protein